MKNKKKIFITGESGTIPLAMQRMALNSSYLDICNCQFSDFYDLKSLKKHQSFSVREPEIDFLDRELLFSTLSDFWESVDVIVHSGAYVGTDYCLARPQDAIRANVEGTNNIVELCNKFRIKLVYFSTTAIFDPADYSEDKPITENTRINPQTLYGITKYCGEQIVDRLCKTDKMIIRPVFGFSDYPDDLHSALTKVMYVIYHNYKNRDISSNQVELDVLLDTRIKKSYVRAENIAASVLNLVDQEEWNEDFNIGEPFYKSLDWYELYQKISDAFLSIDSSMKDCDIFIGDNRINWYKKQDYLHYHNICDAKLRSRKADLEYLDKYLSIDEGIYKTGLSIVKNFLSRPYWI